MWKDTIIKNIVVEPISTYATKNSNFIHWKIGIEILKKKAIIYELTNNIIVRKFVKLG